jgi:hypothetical protein
VGKHEGNHGAEGGHGLSDIDAAGAGRAAWRDGGQNLPQPRGPEAAGTRAARLPSLDLTDMASGYGIRPSLLPEGEVPREVLCCGKRAQSQLRENKKNVNAGLIKGGRPATPPQAVAGGRSLLGRVVTSTAALFFVRGFPITNLLRFGCVQRCISRAALKSGLMSKGIRFVRTGMRPNT